MFSFYLQVFSIISECKIIKTLSLSQCNFDPVQLILSRCMFQNNYWVEGFCKCATIVKCNWKRKQNCWIPHNHTKASLSILSLSVFPFQAPRIQIDLPGSLISRCSPAHSFLFAVEQDKHGKHFTVHHVCSMSLTEI